MLRDGKLNFYWVQVNNNVQAAPNNSNETYPGYRNPDNFVVVSDAYPTVTALSADVILPAAMWVERSHRLKLQFCLDEVIRTNDTPEIQFSIWNDGGGR